MKTEWKWFPKLNSNTRGKESIRLLTNADIKHITGNTHTSRHRSIVNTFSLQVMNLKFKNCSKEIQNDKEINEKDDRKSMLQKLKEMDEWISLYCCWTKNLWKQTERQEEDKKESQKVKDLWNKIGIIQML